MAIEDAFQLGVDMGEALDKVNGVAEKLDVGSLWSTYQSGRIVRAASIHGMARFAAIMASTYKAYLGEGLGPLEFIKQFHIPHPGRVIGRAVLHLTMPAVLDWVLGGNNGHLARARPSACRVEDKLKVFGEKDFETFMRNDNEILRSAHARWMLLSERDPTCETVDATSTIEAKGIYIEQAPLSVGTAAAAAGNGNGAAAVLDLVVAGANVAAEHARVWRDEAGDCWVQDLPGSTGTWINGKLLHKGDKARLLPQALVEFGAHPATEVYRVKMQHNSLPTGGLNGHSYTLIPVGNAARPAVAGAGAAASAPRMVAA
jgi:zeaxanthin epoxidase